MPLIFKGLYEQTDSKLTAVGLVFGFIFHFTSTLFFENTIGREKKLTNKSAVASPSSNKTAVPVPKRAIPKSLSIVFLRFFPPSITLKLVLSICGFLCKFVIFIILSLSLTILYKRMCPIKRTLLQIQGKYGKIF